jgi:hypothetical protein
MIAIQEMLMQEVDSKIYLFPSWPKAWDVRFKLHASGGTTVEAELRKGKVINVKVMPQQRLNDVIY